MNWSKEAWYHHHMALTAGQARAALVNDAYLGGLRFVEQSCDGARNFAQHAEKNKAA